MKVALRWLIWRQKDDGRYVVKVVDSQEEARSFAEKSPNTFYYPTYVEWREGERI